jgi:CheY-like chemotaxis protein
VPHPTAQGARILVVDDDPDIRDVVIAMLEAVGLVALGASNAEQALDMVHSGGFDLMASSRA